MQSAATLSKHEREQADTLKEASAERQRVRDLIQAVAEESERLESELAEQAVGSRLQGEASPEQEDPDAALPKGKALRNFNLMRDGDVIAEVRKGDKVVLTEAEAEKRWWRGYVKGTSAERAGEFLQKFVERVSTPEGGEEEEEDEE